MLKLMSGGCKKCLAPSTFSFKGASGTWQEAQPSAFLVREQVLPWKKALWNQVNSHPTQMPGIFIRASHQVRFNTSFFFYSGNLGEGEVWHEPKFMFYWSMLVIGSLCAI